jgi:parallel beta-helix repeat protein
MTPDVRVHLVLPDPAGSATRFAAVRHLVETICDELRLPLAAGIEPGALVRDTRPVLLIADLTPSVRSESGGIDPRVRDALAAAARSSWVVAGITQSPDTLQAISEAGTAGGMRRALVYSPTETGLKLLHARLRDRLTGLVRRVRTLVSLGGATGGRAETAALPSGEESAGDDVNTPSTEKPSRTPHPAWPPAADLDDGNVAYDVRMDGQGRFETIGDAIAAANVDPSSFTNTSGHVAIRVAPGYYEEHLVLDGAVWPEGGGPGRTILGPIRAEPVVRFSDAARGGLRGLSLRGNNASDASLCYIDGASVTIEQCELARAGKNGVYIDGAGNPLVRAVVVADSAQSGIACFGTGKPRIVDVICERNAKDGIYVAESTHTVVFGTVTRDNRENGITAVGHALPRIDGCRVERNGQYGAFLGQEVVAEFHRNTVTGNVESGLTITADCNAMLENNDVCGNGGPGVFIGRSAEASLGNNQVSSNGKSGIAVFDDAAVTLVGNTVAQNRSYGIYLQTRAAAHIENNTCTENGKSGIGALGDTTGRIERNPVAGNTSHGI